MNWRIIAAALLTMVAPAYGQQQPVRRALIVANSNYSAIASLPAVKTGLATLQPVLNQMRFEVRVAENTTIEQIDTAITKLAADTQPGDVALVFYLGLAVQSLQENYLLPVTFDPAKTKGVDYEAYSMRRFASAIEERQPAFFGLIVDAAWDLPILRRRFPDPGLVRLDPDRPGSLYAMSTSPGKLSGDGSKSLYIQALAEALRQEGLTLNQIVEYVKRSVSEASGGSQLPSEVSTVVRDFYVNPKAPDAAAWDALRESQDPAALRSFAETYKTSKFAPEALSRLEELDWKLAAGKDAAALGAFLAKYPEGKHSADAKSQMGNLLALDAVRRYRTALESRDLGALKALWPSLNKQQVAGLQTFFRDAKSITIEPNPVSPPVLSGDGGATVKVRRSIQYTGQSFSDIAVLKLKRSGGEMLIETQTVEGAGRP